MKYPERIVAMFKELQTMENEHWDKLSAEYIEYGEYTSNYKPDEKMVDLVNRIEEECRIYDAESGADREVGYDYNECWEALYEQVRLETTKPY